MESDEEIESAEGEKPFKCPHCDRAFTQSGNLNNHIRLHTDEKPFKCHFCDKAFVQSGNLSSHIRNNHKFTGSSLEIALAGTNQRDDNLFTAQEREPLSEEYFFSLTDTYFEYSHILESDHIDLTGHAKYPQKRLD
ncbi:hypothetical protein NQ318_016230 [Aromia moschata]|uniref:C2H2-type domain-containing protein n=1 Tax=Aromia moschata TaxID=1265417 RepID=A0AAV8XB91_9CUCU|nr:hypothetical protein NQ318_016230 [Aromia moschata]